MTSLNAASQKSYQEIQRRLRAANKVADTMTYMFEDVDFDSLTGRRIHNLTITWTEPEVTHLAVLGDIGSDDEQSAEALKRRLREITDLGGKVIGMGDYIQDTADDPLAEIAKQYITEGDYGRGLVIPESEDE